MKDYCYYQWPINDVVKHFATNLEYGLTHKQATSILTQKGPNSLFAKKSTSMISVLVRQFTNLFVIILLIAGVISYFIDGLMQALVLLIIVLVNIALGFFQEYKAEKSIQKLTKSFESTCVVLRDRNKLTIESKDIVPGDIVMLKAGDKVPADLRLFDETSLQIDESALTGESLPVSKNIKILPISTSLGDQKNLAFASTIVINGHGKGIVVNTGNSTEIGKITTLIEKVDDRTELEKQVSYLAKIFSIVGLLLTLIVLLLGISKGYDFWKLLTFTIALLIAVVPESLPTAITLSLAIGVTRMAEKKAIVRRLAVIEALGTTNVLATDKTGTLTNNKLYIEVISVLQKNLKRLSITRESIPVISDLIIKASACCNIAPTRSSEESGDPVELAIINTLRQINQIRTFEKIRFTRLMEIPFDSDKKYMAVLVGNSKDKLLIAKGSPEKVVQFCSFPGALDKKEILLEVKSLSSQGYKVIAVAEKKITKVSTNSLTGMKFLGLLAMADEPAPGVTEAFKKVVAAGIKPIIITGDHPETAIFIAKRLGLPVRGDEVVTGDKLLKLSPKEIREVLGKVKIFARITAKDKIDIVQHLKEAGFLVTVTGDGVNDAPALKEAEIGIAMGIKGTDIARESADIVLADDHYSTIVQAIEYGRAIYDNIKNIITQLISGNFNEIMLVFAAFIFGLPLPFVTIQILWINLVIESFAGLSFCFEKPRADILRESPRLGNSSLIKESIRYSGYLVLSSFIIGLLIYLWGLEHSVVLARTLIFCYIVFAELAFALSIRSKKRIWQSPRSFVENKYLIYAVILAVFLQLLIFLPSLRSVFYITSLNISEWSVLIIAVILSFLIAEFTRFRLNKKQAV